MGASHRAYSGCAVPTIVAAATLGLALSYLWAIPAADDGWPKGGDYPEVEAAVHAAYGSARSGATIPRMPVCGWFVVGDCIDATRFVAEFHGRKPLVISGALTAAEQQQWSRAAVLDEFGGAQMAMSVGGALALNQGGGGGLLPPLRDVSARFLADPRYFIFDTSSEGARQLAAREPTPSVLAPAFAGANAPSWNESGRSFVSLSGVDAGLPMHRHGESWLRLLAGRKRWFVSPPGWSEGAATFAPPPPFLNGSAWLRRALGADEPPPMPTAPSTEQGRHRRRPLPRTVLQRPGDVLYLPTDWAHATFNLDECLAVGKQRQYDADELETLERACFPRRPASVDDGAGEPNACVMLGNARRELAATPGAPAAERDAQLGVAAFFYEKAFRLQPLEVRAAAGFVAVARGASADAPGLDDDHAPGQRPGPQRRRHMLSAATRALDAAQAEQLRGAPDGPHDVRPVLASARLLLARAASEPAEREARRALVEGAIALVAGEPDELRRLVLGAVASIEVLK